MILGYTPIEEVGSIEINITVISDSTGRTANSVIDATLVQFDGLEANIHNYTNVRDFYDLEAVMDNILKYGQRQIVYYSLLQEELINYVKTFTELNNIYAVDILTPSIIAVERVTDLVPTIKPGANRELDEKYFKRVEAMEFAVRYDDGKDPRGALVADMVIIGVSRTSKTPLSMYLANLGYRVCNIPLVPESKAPKEIFEISSHKVIGLTNTPKSLVNIRKERLRNLGVSGESSYSDEERIFEELEYAHNIMKRIGCPIINVQNKAIEETAEIIIKYFEKTQSQKE